MRYGLILLLMLASTVFADTKSDSIALVDDLGRMVTLPHPAQRVISLAPHVAETLFAVGAGEQLVGTVTYSDYPEAAKAVPLVGNYKNINYELLISLKPDLVIAWSSGNGDEMIERLLMLGITVYVGEPRALEDVATMLKVFGVLTGREQQGRLAGEQFMATLTEIREANRHKPKLDVFYQVWNDPLVTLNGKHLISDVIRLCGGRNVFADAIPIAPRINVESVINANPQVIIASGMGESRPEWLTEWLDWPVIPAVRDKQLYFIQPDILQRHTPRILEGAQQMCDHLESARTALNQPQ